MAVVSVPVPGVAVSVVVEVLGSDIKSEVPNDDDILICDFIKMSKKMATTYKAVLFEASSSVIRMEVVHM